MNKIKKHCAVPHHLLSRHQPAARQHGMTIIEVLVSMMILALGVLVLLATQLRTAAGVREAEQQTIVSQEVQNLIEGMLANPTLSPSTAASSKGWTVKSYAAYTAAVPAGNIASEAGINKQGLANRQVNDFRQALSDRLPNTNASSTICTDSSGATPTASGTTINWNCNGTGTTTMVKVVWQINTEGTAGNASGLTLNGDKAVYTYQARVTD
jgi:type IV pilus assembly protein PilV